MIIHSQLFDIKTHRSLADCAGPSIYNDDADFTAECEACFSSKIVPDAYHEVADRLYKADIGTKCSLFGQVVENDGLSVYLMTVVEQC